MTDKGTFDSIITGRGVYKLSKLALEEYPEIESIQSKGHKFDVGSGAFKILKDCIFSKTSLKQMKNTCAFRFI